MRRRSSRRWMRRLRRLHRFRRCSWGDRWLLVQAAGWLGVARLAVLTLPLRWIAPLLGQYMQESAATADLEQEAAALRVEWAVGTMSRYTPWKSNCLAQTIAAKRMLQRRRIRSTLYLGVARSDTLGLDAHAWIRSGTRVVAGEQGMARFTAVATFAEGDEVAGDDNTRAAMRRGL